MSYTPAFKLDPDEDPGEPIEVRVDTACRLLGGVNRSTVHRLLRTGALRGRIDGGGLRWVSMRSIKRYQRYQLQRGPTGRPRKAARAAPPLVELQS
jgi:hypothetical protein